MIMKKILNIYIIGLAVIILGGSCEEIYYPKKINSTEKIPVIQGIIEEDKVPVVNLSWALGYKDKVQEYISGANVSVMDNHDNSVKLEETSAGNYTTFSSEFRGIQGRIYTLRVKLQDGNVYTSTPVYLQKKPVIDSLYANPAVRTVYTYNTDNEPVPEDQKGLFILADLNGNTDSMLYYRFNTKMVTEMTYTVGTGPGSYSVYLWATSTLDNSYAVDFTVTQNSRQILLEHPVGFLHYYYDATYETPNNTGIYIVLWVLTFNVYSISRDVYNYYNSIEKQLNTNGQIFAPIPSQVKSNIRCTTAQNKAVIGVFEASSRTTIYKAFRWMDLKVYKSMDLSTFPDIHGGSMPYFPPDFWVNF
jgi:hypothetical protein